MEYTVSLNIDIDFEAEDDKQAEFTKQVIKDEVWAFIEDVLSNDENISSSLVVSKIKSDIF